MNSMRGCARAQVRWPPANLARQIPMAPASPVAPPPPPPVNAAVLPGRAGIGCDRRRDPQVASFGISQQNAEHALDLLRGAAIDGARLLDADVNGRRIWRLLKGPVDEARAQNLRCLVGLGFGQPQRVRDSRRHPATWMAFR